MFVDLGLAVHSVASLPHNIYIKKNSQKFHSGLKTFSMFPSVE